MVMKRVLRLFVALLVGGLAIACFPVEEIEKVEPIIIAQTFTNGTVDVQVEPRNIYIIFDREVRLARSERIYFEPAVTVELSVEGDMLMIKTLEALQYECDYQLTIGKGAVTDALTGGENSERVIGFKTIEGPYVPPIDPVTVLVTPNATKEAQNVYGFLWATYGTRTLSAASINEYLEVNECDWVHMWTRRHPAILNVDYKYLHFSPSAQFNYANLESVISDWWSVGGLFSACWHWMVPVREGVKNNYACEVEGTVVRPSNMLKEGTWEHELMMADLAEMASILMAYQEKGIPVIWRPLHEAAGNSYTETNGKPWFWWGADGAKIYKQLWKTMFDYFKSVGLNNLIWVWNTQLNDIDYYPGDEYVDMIACDIYNALSPSKVVSVWESATKQFPHRMVSLCELGRMCEMPLQMDNGAMWSYFMPWYDNNNNLSESFAHEYATIEWWRAAFEDPRVLSREDMPSLK